MTLFAWNFREMSTDSGLSNFSTGSMSDTMNSVDMMDTASTMAVHTPCEDQLDLLDIPNFQGDLVQSILNEQAAGDEMW
jgi:hypothetical protein